MHPFLDWARATWAGEFVRAYGWVFPTLESLHFVGMALLIGIVGIIDLRVLGIARGLPVAPLHRLLPLAFLGFGLNLVSGVFFFAAEPAAYAFNVAFRLKMLGILLAGLNALWFRLGVFLDVEKWGAGIDTSPLAKLISGVSLLLWTAVIVGGRFIPWATDIGS
jgi:hypothetical protein